MTKQVICISVEEATLKEADRAANALGYSRSRFFETCAQRILKVPEFQKGIKRIEAIQTDDLLKEKETQKQ